MEGIFPPPPTDFWADGGLQPSQSQDLAAVGPGATSALTRGRGPGLQPSQSQRPAIAPSCIPPRCQHLCVINGASITDNSRKSYENVCASLMPSVVHSCLMKQTISFIPRRQLGLHYLCCVWSLSYTLKTLYVQISFRHMGTPQETSCASFSHCPVSQFWRDQLSCWPM